VTALGLILVEMPETRKKNRKGKGDIAKGKGTLLNVIDKLEVQNSRRLKAAYQATSDVLLVMMMHLEVQT
jgi:hypothetical protein